jgi:Eukaryotic-type carbonic anhydrase
LIAGCGGDEEAGEDERSEQQPPAFGYSGAEGPSHWGSLDPAFEECSAGKRQSPIALQDGQAADLPRIDFSYQPADVLEVENNGHSVEAAYPAGSSIAIDEKEFQLEQFHYHAPSEHTLNGRSSRSSFTSSTGRKTAVSPHSACSPRKAAPTPRSRTSSARCHLGTARSFQSRAR